MQEDKTGKGKTPTTDNKTPVKKKPAKYPINNNTNTSKENPKQTPTNKQIQNQNKTNGKTMSIRARADAVRNRPGPSASDIALQEKRVADNKAQQKTLHSIGQYIAVSPRTVDRTTGQHISTGWLGCIAAVVCTTAVAAALGYQDVVEASDVAPFLWTCMSASCAIASAAAPFVGAALAGWASAHAMTSAPLAVATALAAVVAAVVFGAIEVVATVASIAFGRRGRAENDGDTVPGLLATALFYAFVAAPIAFAVDCLLALPRYIAELVTDDCLTLASDIDAIRGSPHRLLRHARGVATACGDFARWLLTTSSPQCKAKTSRNTRRRARAHRRGRAAAARDSRSWVSWRSLRRPACACSSCTLTPGDFHTAPRQQHRRRVQRPRRLTRRPPQAPCLEWRRVSPRRARSRAAAPPAQRAAGSPRASPRWLPSAAVAANGTVAFGNRRGTTAISCATIWPSKAMLRQMSRDARAMERSCPSLYHGCHPVHRTVAEVARNCSAATDCIGMWIDSDLWNSGQSLEQTLSLKFCRFNDGQKLDVAPFVPPPGRQHFTVFEERTGRLPGAWSDPDHDAVFKFALSDLTWVPGNSKHPGSLWSWNGECRTEDDHVAITASDPFFRAACGTWWYLCGAELPELSERDSDEDTEEASGGDSSSDMSSVVGDAPGDPAAEDAPAEAALPAPVDDAAPAAPVDEAAATKKTGIPQIARNIDASLKSINTTLSLLFAQGFQPNGTVIRLTFCKFTSGAALAAPPGDDGRAKWATRVVNQKQKDKSFASENETYNFKVLDFKQADDGNKKFALWKAILNEAAPSVSRVASDALISPENPSFRDDNGNHWYLQAAEVPDQVKVALELQNIERQNKARKPGAGAASAAAAARDEVFQAVDASPRACGTSATDNYDDVAIPTEAEIPAECWPALRRLISRIVHKYDAEAPLADRAAVFHEFLSAPKRFMRRVPGKAPRSLRHVYMMKQLAGSHVLDIPDKTEREPIVPSPEEQDERAAKQATSTAARGYLGKAARALERVFVVQPAKDVMVKGLRRLHPEFKEKTGDDLKNDRSGTNPHHPPTATDADGRSPAQSMSITPDELSAAISNGCKGAAPGPTGWTEELLLPLFAEVDEGCIARKLTLMANDVMNYQVDESVRERLTSCRLVGIGKPCGGVRPIAVSDVLLKAVCAIAMKRLGRELPDHFDGMQYGIQFKGGAETVAHSLRELLKSDPAMQLVALDATNAFNTPSRSHIANALYNASMPASWLLKDGQIDATKADDAAKRLNDVKWQSLWNLFMLEYGKPSKLMLHCGDGEPPTIIESCVGSRQGSCLGGFYFSVCLMPALVEAKRRFGKDVAIFAYLDDVTLAGTDAAALSACADFLKQSFEDANVALNPKKCEWYGNKQHERTGVSVKFNANGLAVRAFADGSSTTVDLNDPSTPECPADATDTRTVAGEKKKEGVKILGCFLSHDDGWIQQELLKKLAKHGLFFRRLKCMGKCSAAALLSACGVPRMSYYVRIHEPKNSKAAATGFDELVIDAWSDISGCEVDELTKLVAHLPTRVGGGGFTRYALIAADAFKAFFFKQFQTGSCQVLGSSNEGWRRSRRPEFDLPILAERTRPVRDLPNTEPLQRSCVVPAIALTVDKLALWRESPGPVRVHAAAAQWVGLAVEAWHV